MRRLLDRLGHYFACVLRRPAVPAVCARPAGLETMEQRRLLSASWSSADAGGLIESLTADEVVVEAEIEPLAASAGLALPAVSASRAAPQAQALVSTSAVTLPAEAVGRYRLHGQVKINPRYVPRQPFRFTVRVSDNGIRVGNLPRKIMGVRVSNNTFPAVVPFVSSKNGVYRLRAQGSADLHGYGEHVRVNIKLAGRVFENSNGVWRFVGKVVGNGEVYGRDVTVTAGARGRRVGA